MVDVLEEVGFDVARRCLWDNGRYSDLARLWRRTPRDELLDLQARDRWFCVWSSGPGQAFGCLHQQGLGLTSRAPSRKKGIAWHKGSIDMEDDGMIRRWVSSQVVMVARAATAEESVRWARCVSEVVKHAAVLCAPSCRWAFQDITGRLVPVGWGPTRRSLSSSAAAVCAAPDSSPPDAVLFRGRRRGRAS